jgi:hypothetical protein
MSTAYEQAVYAHDMAEIAHEPLARKNTTSKTGEASRSTHARFSRSAIQTLKRWCDAHRHNPYPSEQQKEELKAQTGLSVTQISNWLTNARRRGKILSTSRPRSVASDDVATKASSLVAPSDIALASGLAIPLPPSTGEWQKMTPLDRWRNSPPDCEAAPLSAVASAVAASEGGTLGSEADVSESLQEPPLRALSISSIPVSSAYSSSSAGSGSSAYSSNSHGSLDSFRSESSRRRRRKKAPSRFTKITSSAVDLRRYQCTFCTNTFKTKHDWMRHEKTQHLSLERWICLPKGAEAILIESNKTECALCGALAPSEAHMDAHRINDCVDKPVAARTFYRKDHFRQHLRMVHSIQQLTPAVERWTSRITRINCRCGFCMEQFVDWSVRNDHIAEHFRVGASMKDWNGCRGLDPAVAMLVNNAMPPYLIGTESAAMMPFSVETISAQLGSISKDSDVQTTCSQVTATSPGVQPSSFEILTASLGRFVSDMQMIGAALSDESLQRQARIIVYGDDDPWNQTAADNPQWLALFKSGHGLDHISSTLGVFDLATTCDLPLAINPEDQLLMPNHYEDTDWASQMNSMNGTKACSTEPIAESIGITDMPWFWQSPECLAEFRQGRPFCTSADLMNVFENQNIDETYLTPNDALFVMDPQYHLELPLETIDQDHLASPEPTRPD